MCGLSAVTSISEDCISSSMRSVLASMPATQLSVSDIAASPSRRMLCSVL